MKPYYQDNYVQIYHGDCLEVMRNLPDNSIDSIVTDPPYELSFMGKAWDRTGITYNVDMWKEGFRVLKPGGYLLSFGGTRTYHRMACAIEDAGFEIRDMVEWIYGSGFPKSLNIGKAIDRLQGNKREMVEGNPELSGGAYQKGKGKKKENEATSYFTKTNAQITKGTSEWEGWGTALKPAHEPICLARKPLSEKTVASNVLKHGTGGININESRVEFVSEADKKESIDKNQHADFNSSDGIRVPTKGIYRGDFRPPENYNPVRGRFPANLIHDGSEEVMGLFPNAFVHGGGTTKTRGIPFSPVNEQRRESFPVPKGDSGSAARFFYCAKASKSERDAGLEGMESKSAYEHELRTGMNNSEIRIDGSKRKPVLAKNNHPTVKPVALMKYLIKLVTPPNGTVLDPFMGSGSTGKAAILEGFNFIGIEIEEEYIEIAVKRMAQEVLDFRPTHL